ncbi:MAG: hypothetical protein WDN03_16295 [Rhizomicrobium sp.]
MTGAMAAGLMKMETFAGAGGATVTVPYVVPGDDAALFANYVTMLYRTGGSVHGEAPVLSLQASGNLAINASINDGFFQFRDQTSPDYLAATITSSTQILVFTFGHDFSAFTGPTFTTLSSAAFSIASGSTPTSLFVPYDADGNSASPDMVGDPFGSAELFPLLPGNVAANSAALNLVAGAALSRPASTALCRQRRSARAEHVVEGDIERRRALHLQLWRIGNPDPLPQRRVLQRRFRPCQFRKLSDDLLALERLAFGGHSGQYLGSRSPEQLYTGKRLLWYGGRPG